MLVDDTWTFHQMTPPYGAQYRHPNETQPYMLFTALKQGWIETAPHVRVNEKNLPSDALRVWREFWQTFNPDDLLPRGRAAELEGEFYRLTGTTPLDLNFNAEELAAFLDKAMARLVSAEGSAEDKNLFSLELRPWAKGAYRNTVTFYGGEGITGAASLIWADLIYAVDDVPLVYQHLVFQYERVPDLTALDKTLETGGNFEWDAGFFPLMDLVVDAEREKEFSRTGLAIRYDTALLGAQSFGNSEFTVKLNCVSPGDARAFVQTLWDEMNAIAGGATLDPATIAPTPTFAFAKQLLARAYDAVSQEPQNDKPASEFKMDLSKLNVLYDRWHELVPPHGHILEIGCGDGKAEIGQWLERGYQVTGVDVSS
ncbi:MAG: hypothetical protein DCC52_09985, partial [Chloroflexi bacterium]